MDSWWVKNGTSIDVVLFIIVVSAMILLALMVLFIPLTKANAESCLSMDVPSQAVIDQYDGDTFTLFTVGPGGHVKIRVQDVDTPERNKKEPGWEAAREFTRQWLAKGPFKLTTCGKPTLDRIVGIVERDGKTLAQALIEAGHSKAHATR